MKPVTEKKEGSAQARSQTIDAVKGAAILLVMAGHVLVWNHMEDPYLYDVIKVVQMPLFIMVSGYLCGMGRRVGSLSDYGRILKKRALAYLTPFFFWILLLHPRRPLSSVWRVLFDLDEGLWFLMTLFLLTAMVYTAQLAESAARRQAEKRWPEKGRSYGKAAFWLTFLSLAAFVVLETFLGWQFLSPGLTRLYLPFYLAGYLAGEYREKLGRIPETAKRLLCAASLILLLLMAAVWDLQDVSTLFLLGRQMYGLYGRGSAALLSEGRAGKAVPGLPGRLYAGDLRASFPFCHSAERRREVPSLYARGRGLRSGLLCGDEPDYRSDYRGYQEILAA